MPEGPLLLKSGYVIYSAPADFDLATAPDAVSELENLIELHPWVAVDLSETRFIDSSGLSALVWARRKANSLGGDVVLFGATPRTLRMLELTQLDHVFPTYEHSDEIPPASAGSAHSDKA